MVSAARTKLILSSLIACLILAFLASILLFFYYLSSITTNLGSIILFFLFLWYLLRLVVKILVFPGSCWFWKRSIEASFCVQMSNQIFYKIRDFRLYLQSIQNQERFSYKICIPSIINSLTERFDYIKENAKISKFQETLYLNLEDMRKSMKETIVIINSTNSYNLWDWFQERINLCEPNDIVFEDYPDCLQAKKLIKLCSDMEDSLLKSCGPAKFLQKFTRWLLDDTLGSIDYLRADLLKRFNCEQIWVNGIKTKIDW